MSQTAVVDTAARLLDELVHDGRPRSRDEWLELAGGCQQLVNRITAVQDVAIARASSIECVWEEDGTLGEVDRGPGRVALDAADVVAPVVGAGHHQAQRRVEQAVRLAAGREPEPADSGPRPARSGLGGLHAAMREGRLDAYRAGVVAFELAGCPSEVAEAVVAALDPHLADEPGTGLRRRTRRLLARISPELLRQRADRRRAETGLQRWAGEPGVDVWHGTFPTEDSAPAWAALDDLARQFVRDGVEPDLERARGKALTALVLEHSDVQVQVVVAVPADDPSATAREAVVHTAGSDDLVQVHGPRPSEPMLVPAAWLVANTAEPAERVVCDPATGARVDPGRRLTTDAYRPTPELAGLVRARDGRCRFPGCSVATRFCDLDHVRAWPDGPTAADNLICLCRRHHRVKQAPGWRVRLRPDGAVTWTDPTGRVTVTQPVDALDRVVLPAVGGHHPRPPTRPVPSRSEERRADLLLEREVWRRRTVRLRWADLDAASRRRARLARFDGPPPF
jgi:hypothetical protein